MPSHVKRAASPGRRVLRAPCQYLLKFSLARFLKITIAGREHLRDLDWPFIIVANHSSHFDAPLILSSLPRRLARRLACGAAADYFFTRRRFAVLTGLFLNTFPVDRDQSGRHRGLATELLNRKVPIAIMPEGTRSRDGRLAAFQPGAAALALKHQVPVLPVALIGTHAAWPPETKRWKAGRPAVRVQFGAPLRPEFFKIRDGIASKTEEKSEEKTEEKSETEIVAQFNQCLRTAVEKLYNNAYESDFTR